MKEDFPLDERSRQSANERVCSADLLVKKVEQQNQGHTEMFICSGHGMGIGSWGGAQLHRREDIPDGRWKRGSLSISSGHSFGIKSWGGEQLHTVKRLNILVTVKTEYLAHN